LQAASPRYFAKKFDALLGFVSLFVLTRFPMAFKYVGTDSQGDVTGKVKRFQLLSTHSTVLGPGDLVITTAASGDDGQPTVDVAPTDTAFTGVIASITPNFSSEALSQTWVPGSTAGYVLVNVDPYALYEADVSNGPLAAADVGLNCPSVVTAGTVSGSLYTSNMGINATGKATTATLPWRVVALLEDEDGVLGNRALVRANATTLNIGATGT